MPSSSKMMLTLAALLTATYALPMPQGAGTGAAFDSLFSDTDTGVGLAVENAEDNTANTISGAKGGVPARRSPQGAGTGAALDSLFSDIDTGVGLAVENAEDNTANLISGSKGTASTGGGSAAGPPPPPPHARRQLDKIAKGAQALSNAAGTGAETSALTDTLVNVDGETTSGQAAAGAALGNAEATTLENVGSAIPKRQLDKIAKGAQAISNAAGTGAVTSTETNGLVSIDGATTDGQAGIGAAVGSAEENTLEAVGSTVPKRSVY